MTKEKLVLHMLTVLPPHNVNRDEDGRPKTAMLGGILRGRMSSQAKKRALRFSPHSADGQRATRTRLLGIEALVRLLDEGGADLDTAVLVSQAVNKATGADDDPATEKTAKEKAKKLRSELKDAAGLLDERPLRDRLRPNTNVMNTFQKVIGPAQAIVVSAREQQALGEEMSALLKAFRAGDAGAEVKAFVERANKTGFLSKADLDLDLALFGRMVAANADYNIEAATSVGHAITTHAFSIEADYFSAGEELESSFRGTGAAITSYGFYGSGIYYQHAVLDYDHLLQNLDGDGDLARRAVEVFLRGLVCVQPKGKRNSFASDTTAAYVLARRTTGPTVNLGFAFLDPVRVEFSDGRPGERDLIRLSIERLKMFDEAITGTYGIDGERCVFNAYPPARDPSSNTPPEGEVWTYAELGAFAAQGIA